MANARKCDRCGTYYEQYGVANSRKNPNAIMLINLDDQRKYFSHTAKDLCPDCMDKVKKFMEGSELSEEADHESL